MKILETGASFLKMAGGLLIMVFIGLLIGRYLFPNIPKQPYYQKSGFKTDTFVKKEYIPIKIKGDPIPPKYVVRYRDSKVIPQIPRIEYRDTTVYLLDTHHNVLGKINENFITYMSGNPKILYGAFTGQGLSFDLLDTTGSIRTLAYETDYSSNDYFFNGSFITVSKKSARSIPKISRGRTKLTSNSNLYLTYEIFRKTPNLAADYSINIGKLGIYTSAQVGYNTQIQNTEFRLNAGLRVKLK